MTLLALVDLGVKEIWVEPKLPTSDAHAFELAVKHNMRYGSWTEDLVAELSEKYKLEIDLPKLELDLGKPIDLQTLLDRYGPEVEEDEVPEVPEEAISKLGEVYQLGRHRLVCGDATKIEDVEKLMDGKKAELLVTSPPYWVGKEYEKEQTWEEIQRFIGYSSNVMAKYTNNSGRIVINTGTCPAGKFFNNVHRRKLLIDDWGNYLETYGWLMRWCGIWVKESGGGLSADADSPDPSWEFLGVFYNPNGNYKGANKLDGKWPVMSYWDDIRGKHSEEHTAVYPVELPSRFIRLYSKQDDIVLDLFGGSGSTLIAAEQTNRINFSMEIDPRYVDVIRKRYENFINK